MQHQNHLSLDQNHFLVPNLQSNQQSNEQSNSAEVSEDQDSDTQYPQLDSEEIQKTLTTLKKLKKIAKHKKLTQLKTSNSKVNALFKKMSYFFIYRTESNKKKKLQAKKLKDSRKAALKAVGIRNKLQNNAQFPPQSSVPEIIQEFSNQLKSSNLQINRLKCYVCKCNYTEVHHFYDCLCVNCGDLNFAKRTQTANLNGYVALVTGARIKIGYEIAVKLLRDGATVIATSRFWKDALLRYQKERDYEKWAERLYLIQCDFTSSSQVAELIGTVKEKFTKLDILINNAAQTIVRPKEFYLKEIVNETKEIKTLPVHLIQFQPKSLLKLCHRYPSLYLPEKQATLLALENDDSTPQEEIHSLQLAKSQNSDIDHEVRDEFDQPLDKRQKNSWVEKLDQVSLIDCYSTQLVNSIVPFHLISQLKCLMKKRPEDEKKSYIVNVSSMEGVFYRAGKSTTHPHTNMAKAALNMITRTSGREFAEDNIYMNSVDTGWVTEENPYGFKCERVIPLDCLDGAMRVLDVVYSGVREKKLTWGKFVKDYKESSW